MNTDHQTHGKEADLHIGPAGWQYPDWKGIVYPEGTRDALALLCRWVNLAEINVHVDSYGGEVSEGFAIYNALRAKNAQITTHADGFVASAAIYPFLAGTQRIANNVSAFYFHPVIGGTYGYSEDLREAADELDKLTEIGLGAFTNAGMKEQAARDLINSKTWYSPEAVLEMGLATSIQKGVRGDEATQSVHDMLIRQTLAVPSPAPKKPPQEPPAPPQNNLLSLFSKL